MPGPDTSEADKELDALFAEDTGDKLPVVKAPLPHVNKVLDLKSSPEADAELEKLMAEPEGPHHATKEEANSAEMPTSGKTIEMPVQKIEGKAPSRISGLESLLRGAGKQLTANFGDEIVGGLGNALRPSTREGIPAQYAGMDAIDSQRQDEAQAATAHPNYDTAGQVIGATGLGMLMPGGNLASQTGSAAAQLVGSQLGQGQGSLGDRRDQAEQNFREHPISTAAAVAAPAIVQGVANVAPKAAAKANELMTHTFMTAPQRAALRAAKGPDALSKLGADAEAAGLFNRRSPMDFFKPISANRVADNAARVQAESGKAIGDFEDQLAAKGVNPDVPVAPIADELRNQAGTVGKVRDVAAAPHAEDMGAVADALDQRQPIPAAPNSGTMPLQDAIATKRFQGDQINWARNPNTTPIRRGEDVARKFTWGQLKDTIQRSLDEQAAKGTVDPAELAKYRAANKNFTTASTAYDPALRMAERNNQTGLSLRDLMAGSMFGGPTGTVTALASGAARGKLPSSMARGLKATAGVAKAVGAAGPAIRGAAVVHAQNPVEQAKAELPPETPDHEVKATANSQVKENLGNWYDRFLQKKE